MAACPLHDTCVFYRTVEPSIVLKMKYASSYPYCKGGRHGDCAISVLMTSGQAVPNDLLPDGERADYAGSGSSHPVTRTASSAGSDYLVVEDSPVFATIAANAVRQHFPGANVRVCTNFEDATRVIREGGARLVISGYGLGSGKTVLDLRALTSAPILIFTGRPTEDRELPSASRVVTKGAGPDALHQAMDSLLGA